MWRRQIHQERDGSKLLICSWISKCLAFKVQPCQEIQSHYTVIQAPTPLWFMFIFINVDAETNIKSALRSQAEYLLFQYYEPKITQLYGEIRVNAYSVDRKQSLWRLWILKWFFFLVAKPFFSLSQINGAQLTQWRKCFSCVSFSLILSKKEPLLLHLTFCSHCVLPLC